MPSTVAEIEVLLEMPFNDLMFKAQTIHRQNFASYDIQISTLLSIKTGGCPEDCGYCPQSVRHPTAVVDEPLLELEQVISEAQLAKSQGATRFCMGAAWRGPKQKDLEPVLAMIKAVRELGLETCATLGMLRDGQAQQLKAAGLHYYNHNLDTSPEMYGEIIHTRDYEDRLATLKRVREAGLNVCCGGIVGMGESRAARAGLLAQLANLTPQPESVPINLLVQVAGTPLFGTEDLDEFEFIRTIAAARISIPRARVRLSAGRSQMSETMQALCFLAGANSIFYGEKLLTTDNPAAESDKKLFAKLGLSLASTEEGVAVAS